VGPLRDSADSLAAQDIFWGQLNIPGQNNYEYEQPTAVAANVPLNGRNEKGLAVKSAKRSSILLIFARPQHRKKYRHFGGDDERINPEIAVKLTNALDQIREHQGPKALCLDACA